MSNPVHLVSKKDPYPLVSFFQTGDETDRLPDESATLLNHLIQETRHHVSFAVKMFEIAREEDWGPGGWNPDDFGDILFQSFSALAILPANTEEEIKTRLEVAQEMIQESVATYTGARACVALGKCREVVKEGTKKFAPDFQMRAQMVLKSAPNHSFFTATNLFARREDSVGQNHPVLMFPWNGQAPPSQPKIF